MAGSILSREDINRLVRESPPLLEGYVNLAEQVQPNGIDLTLRDVAMLQSAGRITVDNKERIVSDLTPLMFDERGFMFLVPGVYIITYNEVVNLPCDIMAFGFPRSSLLRCGATIHTAVWDAGYSGRSTSLLTVFNPQGFTIQRQARCLQLVFHRLSQKTEGYNGIYQGENK